MSDSITIRNKGQINVVFNQQKRDGTPPVAEKREGESRHYPLDQIEAKMKRLIGLEEVKKTIREIYAWLYINRLRKQYQLKAETQTLHMLFKGNPGTGKTTVARLLGELFAEMGILAKGHLIEAERADLVGEYIGQTAQKTRDLIKKAQGGILFVDEAYSLARGGEKDFGKEAIDTLVKHMEDKKDDFILILAGYSKEMDRFMKMNPGLPSRFPIIITFPNYTDQELFSISEQMLQDREYKLTTEARWKLNRHLKQKVAENERDFSNGRYVRNIIEKSIRRQAVRCLREGAFDRESLMTIRAVDLTFDDTSSRHSETEAETLDDRVFFSE